MLHTDAPQAPGLRGNPALARARRSASRARGLPPRVPACVPRPASRSTAARPCRAGLVSLTEIPSILEKLTKASRRAANLIDDVPAVSIDVFSRLLAQPFLLRFPITTKGRIVAHCSDRSVRASVFVRSADMDRDRAIFFVVAGGRLSELLTPAYEYGFLLVSTLHRWRNHVRKRFRAGRSFCTGYWFRDRENCRGSAAITFQPLVTNVVVRTGMGLWRCPPRIWAVQHVSCVQCLAQARALGFDLRLVEGLRPHIRLRRQAEHPASAGPVPTSESESTLTFFFVGFGALRLVARSRKFRPPRVWEHIIDT